VLLSKNAAAVKALLLMHREALQLMRWKVVLLSKDAVAVRVLLLMHWEALHLMY